MTTDTLLLHRAMGTAIPEDYVDWAVDRLGEGPDTPSLRILAGLNPGSERYEIEPYFEKTCAELNIEAPTEGSEPRRTVGLVKRSYELGELSADAALQMMATLYQQSEYSDPILTVWYEIEEELSLRGSGYEGCFYPPEALDSLDDVLEREWSLFTRASRLNLPKDFYRFIRCDQCGHIGKSKLTHKTLTAKITAKIPWFRPKPPQWHACTRCGSYAYHSITDPDVRDGYFKQLEGEHQHDGTQP